MQTRTYPHIVRFITQHPWAILPEKLHAIAEFLSHRLVTGPTPKAFDDGDREGPTPEQLHAHAAARGAAYDVAGQVAVIKVMGTVMKRLGGLAEFSGGFGIERATATLRQALADPGISSILLQIDSPGGSVYGVQEFASEIFRARGTKKIVAIADDLAASAAYWIGSAAEELVVTPSGEVGSIGVVAMHVDYSKALEEEGIKVTFVHAGDNKVEGNPYEPLSEDAKAFQQSRVDDYYREFVKAVGKGRGVPPSEVAKKFGQGRVFGSDYALQAGMVDRVATLTETLDRMQPRTRAPRSNAAALAEAHIASARLTAS